MKIKIGKYIFGADQLVGISEETMGGSKYYKFYLNGGHIFEVRTKTEGVEEATALWNKWSDSKGKIQSEINEDV